MNTIYLLYRKLTLNSGLSEWEPVKAYTTMEQAQEGFDKTLGDIMSNNLKKTKKFNLDRWEGGARILFEDGGSMEYLITPVGMEMNHRYLLTKCIGGVGYTKPIFFDTLEQARKKLHNKSLKFMSEMREQGAEFTHKFTPDRSTFAFCPGLNVELMIVDREEFPDLFNEIKNNAGK